MRSHVVSEYVGGGWTGVEDVVGVSVGACSLPDVRGWVPLSWVRSSGESPRITVPSGDYRPGEGWCGVNVSESLLMPRQANALWRDVAQQGPAVERRQAAITDAP
jgi:hypothetical protein